MTVIVTDVRENQTSHKPTLYFFSSRLGSFLCFTNNNQMAHNGFAVEKKPQRTVGEQLN
jgi:hypothetical protein